MFENLTMEVIVSGLVIGMVGFVMFLYGKREGQPITVLAGLALGILPMVLHTMLVLWIVSAAIFCGVALHRRHAETSVVA